MAELKNLTWLAIDSLDLSARYISKVASPEPSSVALLQYTSGSTANPKGVMVTHKNLIHNLTMMRHAFKHTDRTVMVSWLPLYHDMGLIGVILSSMFNGVPCYFMAPAEFLKKPLRWLDAISRYRGTFCGAPNFAYDLCVKKIGVEERKSLDLSSWEVACNGSEPVRAETLKRFNNAFRGCGFREEVFNPVYGLAEATLFVSGGEVSRKAPVLRADRKKLSAHRVEKADELSDAIALVSCGTPWLDQQIRIVNPETQRLCAEGEIGEIWIEGPSVASGYWGRPETTKETFHAHLSDGASSRYLRTGDLGCSYENELYITGRIKDLIIIRGQNIYPQDIEYTVEAAHPSLRAGCSVAFSTEVNETERLVVVCETEREYRRDIDCDEVLERIRQAISAKHEIDVHAIVLSLPGRVLKTSSGKVQRQAMRCAYEQSEIESIAEWKSFVEEKSETKSASGERAAPQVLSAIETWLMLELAASIKMPIGDVDIQIPVTRYGLDSLGASLIVSRIEETFEIALPIETLFVEEPSIRELAEMIHVRMPSTYSQRCAIGS
jgi:acyl-CoA synthetase (AMP-forming)/AMP-acid ligase II/acyl carrier protein